MTLDADKENLCINRIIGQKSENVIIEGDVIVPDIKPDILNTINTSGNICIYKKEVLDGKIRIDGSVNIYIMYLADNESNSIRALNTNLDFTQVLDFADARMGMSLEEQTNVRSIDCKVLNGRKVAIKAGLEIRTKVYSNDNIEFVKQINNIQDIQLLNKGFGINSLIGEGTSKAYAKDTVVIDNIDNLAEILKVDVKLVNKDTKVSYNKVLAKADASVKIMYLTEDNRISSVSNNIPVMGFIDIPDVSDENLCDMRYELKNLLIKPNSVEEHSIYVEAEVELSCRVYQNRNIQVIQDLYSPSVDLAVNQNELRTMTDKKILKEVCNIRESQSIPEINGNKIYDVEVTTNITNQTILNDRIVYEGEVQLKFIFSSDNASRMDTKLILIPYHFTMDAPGVTNNCNIDTEMEVITDSFIIMPDGNIDIKIDLSVELNISRNTMINVINQIDIEECRNITIYSMVIYFVKPGDTLWNIAKRFRSTVEDIARVNGIEDVNVITPGQQLFIPKYVGGSREKTA